MAQSYKLIVTRNSETPKRIREFSDELKNSTLFNDTEKENIKDLCDGYLTPETVTVRETLLHLLTFQTPFFKLKIQ